MTGKKGTAKWCKGIPELESLTLITQEQIGTKVAKQLLVIMMTVICVSVTVFIYLSFQYPELAAYMDGINNALLSTMIHKTSHHSLTGDFIAVFTPLVPLLFVLFGPPLLVFFTLNKKRSSKNSRNLAFRDRFGYENKHYLCRSAKSHDRLGDRRYILFHPVSASRSYGISLYANNA